ncbi:fimbrial protein [Ursidibacter sp. B-7004-1]
MKTILSLCLALLVSPLYANPQVISITFPAISWDYPRDNFMVQTISQIQQNVKISEKVSLQFDVKAESEALDLLGQKVYPTNIDGIGISLAVNNTDISTTLIAYKPLQAGTYSITSKTLATLLNSDNQTIYTVNLQPTQLTIKARSCQLQQSNQTVKLASAFQSELTNKGSEVFGGYFNLALLCDPNVKAFTTFFDQNNIQNHSSILSLDTNKSTAKGVGIRIYKENNEAIELGKEWLFSEDQLNPQHRFSAKYVSLGNVSAGTVNAVATVTFSYR